MDFLVRIYATLSVIVCLLMLITGKAIESNVVGQSKAFSPDTDEAATLLSTIPSPKLYDVEGNHVTFPISQSNHANIRYRRDVGAGGSNHHPVRRYTTYVDIGERKALEVDLHSLTALVAPSTRMEWTVDGVTQAQVVPQDCLYVSRVRDGSNDTLESVVTLCGGLTGIIMTADKEIHIQPAAVDPKQRTSEHTIWTQDLNLKGQKSLDLSGDNPFLKHSVLDKRHPESPLHNTGRHGRQKRGLFHRGTRTMEVLLVIDKSVVRFHGRSLVQQYLVTQLYLVNNVYHHPSLGVEIDVFLVKIHEIEDHLMDDMIVHGQGKKILRNFCEWVSVAIKDIRYDVAVYMTREDMGPAGYAHVTGMCNMNRSCAVIKDDGISSAFVIAHEIGHVFGMVHDGTDNNCDQEAEDGKIMASMVQSNYHKYYWTECSRNVLENVLETLLCLLDKPEDPIQETYSQPYGQSWSLDEQCRQEFGSGYQLCSAFDHLNSCQHLWCSTDEKPLLCKSKRGPPLPGTSCGRGKWCMDEECVLLNHVAEDGDWATWTSWGECSRSCATGIHFRYRTCTDPPPKHGGKECEGHNEEHQTCNRQACKTPVDFRAEQCWEHNEITFTAERRHRWLPAENEDEAMRCRLTCLSLDTMDTLTTDNDVTDGTRCSYENPSDICVRGNCQKLGCDGIFDSDARDDACGVCQGDNSTCHVVSRQFSEKLAKTAYHRLLTLPAQARNIVIRESHAHAHLAHFLSMRELETERFLLNAKAKMSRDLSHFVIHGARFTYTKSGQGESLTARGPLLAPVEVLVYSFSEVLPATIDYEYTVPEDMDIDNAIEVLQLPPLPKDRYMWQTTGISTCSKTCGGGVQREGFICVDQLKRHMSEGVCSQEDQPPSPDIPCNEQPCNTISYEWQTGEWQKCTTTCGIHGIHQRRVFCEANVYGKKNEVDPGYCHIQNMPLYTRGCNRMPCPAPWRASTWSACSASCGSGLQTRAVECAKPSDGNRYTCDHVVPPTDTRICTAQPCPGDSTALPLATVGSEVTPRADPLPTTEVSGDTPLEADHGESLDETADDASTLGQETEVAPSPMPEADAGRYVPEKDGHQGQDIPQHIAGSEDIDDAYDDEDDDINDVYDNEYDEDDINDVYNDDDDDDDDDDEEEEEDDREKYKREKVKPPTPSRKPTKKTNQLAKGTDTTSPGSKGVSVRPRKKAATQKKQNLPKNNKQNKKKKKAKKPLKNPRNPAKQRKKSGPWTSNPTAKTPSPYAMTTTPTTARVPTPTPPPVTKATTTTTEKVRRPRPVPVTKATTTTTETARTLRPAPVTKATTEAARITRPAPVTKATTTTLSLQISSGDLLSPTKARATCPKDKSVFCKMGFSPQACGDPNPYYRDLCCLSCALHEELWLKL